MEQDDKCQFLKLRNRDCPSSLSEIHFLGEGKEEGKVL